MMDALYSD